MDSGQSNTGPKFAPVILAGGSGTRFWPRSRRARAKQVLALDGERTMIQQTLDRLLPLAAASDVWVITNSLLAEVIAEQLPEVPRRNILSEPAARNTAPACALAAFLLERSEPDTVIGIFPADHVVKNEKRFAEVIRVGVALAASGEKIVVLGVPPARAETGYGYIELGDLVEPEKEILRFAQNDTLNRDENLNRDRNLNQDGNLNQDENLNGDRNLNQDGDLNRDGRVAVRRVKRFTEKPERARAEEFLASGNYAWNGGIFLWSARTLAGAVREQCPAMAALLEKIAAAHGGDDFEQVFAEVYPQCQNISIDYAVLEPRSAKGEMASEIYCLAADFEWNDLGSWAALHEHLTDGQIENFFDATDPVSCTIDAQRNYVYAPGKVVALVGVDDLVVVDTGDCLLITKRERSQDVGKVVGDLKHAEREGLT